MTTSLDRLEAECGEQLRELGFATGDRWWRSAWTDWRPVWTGYTPEQRRLLKDGTKPATLRQGELV
jgi:hypothetical protein